MHVSAGAVRNNKHYAVSPDNDQSLFSRSVSRKQARSTKVGLQMLQGQSVIEMRFLKGP